ncbi:MAG: efflux RND transporter permease subunit [Planctomycetes bacterium]|nr:efflux RND transporter permease subunit [Planctomycetota bacterium]
MFAVLLILAAGFFPLQAIVGLGTSETAWRFIFLSVVATVTGFTVYVTRGILWQTITLVSLLLLSLWAYHFTKIGVSFMPPLDEGTMLDMPTSVPRVSVTQAADDLKHRDGLFRGFPEVESVIGKAGRADTPTDPAPLEMFETIVNFRPRALWPKRVLKFADAARQSRDVLRALEEAGFVNRAPHEDDRDALINDATQKALERFDESMRDLALLRYREFERELAPTLTRFVIAEAIRRFGAAGDLRWPNSVDQKRTTDDLTSGFVDDFGRPLAKHPALEDITRMTQQTSQYLATIKAFRTWYQLTEASLTDLKKHGVPESVVAKVRKLKDKAHPSEEDFQRALAAILTADELAKNQNQLLKQALTMLAPGEALALKEGTLPAAWTQIGQLLGGEEKTFAGEVLKATSSHRDDLWRQRVKKVNWELFDRGVEFYTWYAIEELVKSATEQALVSNAPRESERELFHEAAMRARLGKGTAAPARAKLADDPDREVFKPFAEIREKLEKPFKDRVFFWPRQSGPKGDLIDDEMGRVFQVPGWSNIFTQPIINRIEMLSTGVRTDIGVKVFGPDLQTIERVCKDIEAAVKPINGARDVVTAQAWGKGYLEIDIDREKAARYGIAVEDIQNEVEVALGGKAVTFTVEKRDRFPVRLRYARVNREDEESVKRLLVSAGSSMKAPPAMGIGASGMGFAPAAPDMGSTPQAGGSGDLHKATPAHVARGKAPIPLSAVASVQIVEGPSMIKSENGRLLNYVTLMVRGRDMVGFVDEAKRVVAQKVQLPEGVHIEWSGEFEHQVRAAQTLRFVFPAVIVLIFVILYLTYKDLSDAGLMMLAVPEALAGGAFFMYFYPAIRYGWHTPPMDFSVAVWVGFIACFGMATETGIIMLVYLREAIDKRGGLENIKSLEELRQAVIEGAVHRLRPKLLTEGVAIVAIFPMVFATGVGGEILAPMALPVLGGLLISDEVVDIFLPVRFYWVRRARWLKLQQEKAAKAQGQAPAVASDMVA